MAEETASAFILRLGADEAERNLFLRAWIYVGVNRPWTKGSKIFFLQKTNAVLGFCVVGRVVRVNELPQVEMEVCQQRNWSAKLYFSKVVRFQPPVPIAATPIEQETPMGLHGSEISGEVCATIEGLANVKMIF